MALVFNLFLRSSKEYDAMKQQDFQAERNSESVSFFGKHVLCSQSVVDKLCSPDSQNLEECCAFNLKFRFRVVSTLPLVVTSDY